MNAPEMRQSNYERLASINVNEHTEKKANLTYLSWAWAVDQLLRVDPDATWVYSDPVKFGDTMMVFCTVRAFNKPMTAQLPVMDHRNKAIANPDAFQVNTAMQRCLAKAIALHGLGLYIYAGEDLPEGSEVAKPTPQKPASVARVEFDKLPEDEQQFLRDLAIEVIGAKSISAMYDAYQKAKASLDSDEQVAFWSLFDSKQRSAIKAEGVMRENAAKTKPTLAEAM